MPTVIAVPTVINGMIAMDCNTRTIHLDFRVSNVADMIKALRRLVRSDLWQRVREKNACQNGSDPYYDYGAKKFL